MESSEYVHYQDMKDSDNWNNVCIWKNELVMSIWSLNTTIDHWNYYKNTSNTFLTEGTPCSPSTIPFFDNLSTTSSNSDSSTNFLSPPRTGFHVLPS